MIKEEFDGIEVIGDKVKINIKTSPTSGKFLLLEKDVAEDLWNALSKIMTDND